MFKDKPDTRLIQALGGHVRIVYRFKPAVAASLPEQAVENLARNPKVAYVVRDLPIKPVEQTVPWGVERIGATALHNSSNKGAGLT